MTAAFQADTLVLGQPSVIKIVQAAVIVEQLLEADEEIKDFLDRHANALSRLQLQQVMQGHGYRLLKTHPDGTVVYFSEQDDLRYWLYFNQTVHDTWEVYASAQRMQQWEDHQGHERNSWVDFEIDEGWLQNQSEPLHDFVVRVVERVIDFNGPDSYDPGPPAFDDD